MEKAPILKLAVLIGLLALAVSAYAANTITLNQTATLNGKPLDAGQYEVKVSPSGDVSFLRGKTEVAKAKARLEDRGSKSRFNTVVTKATEASSLPSITEIQFQGKKQVLVFENSVQDLGDSSRH